MRGGESVHLRGFPLAWGGVQPHSRRVCMHTTHPRCTPRHGVDGAQTFVELLGSACPRRLACAPDRVVDFPQGVLPLKGLCDLS